MAAAAPAEEEVVQKNRLLLYPAARTDHLKEFAKRLYSLSGQLESSNPAMNWDEAEYNLLLELGGFALQHRRADAICEASEKEQQSYAVQQDQLQRDIEQAHLDIAQAKKDLEAAKRVRGQNEEYEELRRSVMQHTKRSDLQAASEELDQEIAAIADDDRAAVHTTQWRRKQYTVLMNLIRDIQSSMEDETEDLGLGTS